MPKLPAKLQPVVALQIVSLRNLHFATDFKELVEAIEAAVGVPPGRLGPDGMRYREIPAGTSERSPAMPTPRTTRNPAIGSGSHGPST